MDQGTTAVTGGFVRFGMQQIDAAAQHQAGHRGSRDRTLLGCCSHLVSSVPGTTRPASHEWKEGVGGRSSWFVANWVLG